MPEINLSCACGQVQGKTENVNAQSGNRIHYCCADCQKFAVFLEQENKVLEQYGATDIFQMPMAHLKITQGNEHVALMRLSPKGLNRWYAKCCNTPIGNTLGSKHLLLGLFTTLCNMLKAAIKNWVKPEAIYIANRRDSLCQIIYKPHFSKYQCAF